MSACLHKNKTMSSVVIPVDAWGTRRPWVCRDCGERGSHFEAHVDEYTRALVAMGKAGEWHGRSNVSEMDAIMAAHEKDAKRRRRHKVTP